MADSITASNVIDSRDVIERLAELERLTDSDTYELDEWERDELAALRDLAEQGEQEAAEWQDGAALINEGYFAEYAKELAIDLGMINREAADSWPANCINWDEAAEDLQVDYNTVTFHGVTYYVRA